MLTVRPRSDLEEQLTCFQALGIRHLRVNFARRDVEENNALVSRLLAFYESSSAHPEIFCDLPGRKPRLGQVRDVRQVLVKDREFLLDRELSRPATEERAPLGDSFLYEEARPEDLIALASGVVTLQVISRKEEGLCCRILKGGIIYSECGVMLVNRYVANSTLSEADRLVLHKMETIPEFLCPSFVDDPAIIEELRALERTPFTKGIIAKIESPAALENLDAIAAAADGLMLARGDLASFFNAQEIHVLGDRLAAHTHSSRRILVVATDYFKSMYSGGNLSDSDRGELERAREWESDYILVNETVTSPAWRAIAEQAAQLEEDWGR